MNAPQALVDDVARYLWETDFHAGATIEPAPTSAHAHTAAHVIDIVGARIRRELAEIVAGCLTRGRLAAHKATQTPADQLWRAPVEDFREIVSAALGVPVPRLSGGPEHGGDEPGPDTGISAGVGP